MKSKIYKLKNFRTFALISFFIISMSVFAYFEDGLGSTIAFNFFVSTYLASALGAYYFGFLGSITIDDEGLFINRFRNFSWKDLQSISIREPGPATYTSLGKYVPSMTLVYKKNIFKRRITISGDFIDNFDDLLQELTKRGELRMIDLYLWKK